MAAADDYDIDIAVTFVNEDLAFAGDLRDRLGSAFNVFVYNAKQEELAGTDGLQSLREVFRNRARLVVILNRARWGKTDWSRIEEEAITDRFLKEGPSFLFVIMMDDSAPPPWLPDKLIRFKLKDFGIEQAVGAIKARAIERGSTVQPPSLAKLATEAHEQAEFGKRRAQLFRTEEGVKQVAKEARSLIRLIAERAAEAKSAAAGLGIEFGTDENACVIRTREVSVVCGYLNRILNVLDEAQLILREFRGQLILPGQNAYYVRHPRELSEHVFKPELIRGQGWCWKAENGKIFSTQELAEWCLTRFLDLVNRNSRGDLPAPSDDD